MIDGIYEELAFWTELFGRPHKPDSLFIVEIDGSHGVGKTTIINALARVITHDWEEEYDIPKLVEVMPVFERYAKIPGLTFGKSDDNDDLVTQFKICDNIIDVQNAAYKRALHECESLPTVLLLDRCWESNIAYSIVRGLTPAAIRGLMMRHVSAKGFAPDLRVLIDAPEAGAPGYLDYKKVRMRPERVARGETDEYTDAVTRTMRVVHALAADAPETLTIQSYRGSVDEMIYEIYEKMQTMFDPLCV